MQLHGSPRRLVARAAAYTLTYTADDPWFVTLEHAGETWRLSLAAGVHPPAGPDAVGVPELSEAVETPAGATWSFRCASRTWETMTVRLFLRDTDLDLQVAVTGHGAVETVTWLEGAAEAKMPHPRATMHGLPRAPRPLRAYAIASPATHATVFCPQPESYHRPVRPACEEAMVTAACTFGPHAYNTYFSPGIFCFVLGNAAGTRYLSAGLCAAPGTHHYHTFRYHGGAEYGFSLAYDGMTAVRGEFASPRLRLAFAEDRLDALRDYVSHLRAAGYVAADPARPIPAWWRGPIFCGWGQQTHWGRAAEQRLGLPFDTGPVDSSAGGMAHQRAYEEMVRLLDAAEIPFGTLIIDMGWSLSHPLPQADPAKWPDLRGFIDRMHARGKRVLLWMCCWTADGVPPELLMDADPGVRPLPDPTKPGFIALLAERITRCISPAGLDADGFKLDFTGDLPRGGGYRPAAPLWGVELLRHYLSIIHGPLKAAKPEAMLETHCATPYLADLTDVLRLNDMFFETPDVNPLMAFRAQMARIACPEWLIDCDNDPFMDRGSWMAYNRFQPQIGIPSLYTITHMSMSGEPIPPEDLREIADIWRAYLAALPAITV